jgi:hypothetical protein
MDECFRRADEADSKIAQCAPGPSSHHVFIAFFGIPSCWVFPGFMSGLANQKCVAARAGVFARWHCREHDFDPNVIGAQYLRDPCAELSVVALSSGFQQPWRRSLS